MASIERSRSGKRLNVKSKLKRYFGIPESQEKVKNDDVKHNLPTLLARDVFDVAKRC